MTRPSLWCLALRSHVKVRRPVMTHERAAALLRARAGSGSGAEASRPAVVKKLMQEVGGCDSAFIAEIRRLNQEAEQGMPWWGAAGAGGEVTGTPQAQRAGDWGGYDEQVAILRLHASLLDALWTPIMRYVPLLAIINQLGKREVQVG